jgi:hypothetical protein
MRAAVERDIEACRIRDAAPADPRGSFDQSNLQAGRSKPPSRSYAGSAGPNDNDIDDRAWLPSGNAPSWLRNRGSARDGCRGSEK